MKKQTAAEAAVPDDEQPTLFELSSRTEAKLMDVDVRKIDVEGLAAFEPHEVTELADSIRRVTLLHRPILQRAAGGRYSVVVGRRRCAALQQLAALDPSYQRQQFYVRTDHVPDADIAKLVLTENARRSANILAELAAINTLLAQNKMTEEGVAKSVGQHRHWVKVRLGLNRLLPKHRTLMEKGRLRFATAQGLAKLDHAQQQLVWEAYAAKRKEDKHAILSGQDVAAATAVAPVPLSASLFPPLPPTEPVPSNGGAPLIKFDPPPAPGLTPFAQRADDGRVVITVWSAEPPTVLQRRAMEKAVALLVKAFSAPPIELAVEG